jgi:hypothetical protein
MTKIYYALYEAAPNTEPPFDLALGYGKDKVFWIKDCAHIPDATQKIEAYIAEHDLELDENFTLIYPIYLGAMNTEYESTMLQIACLIKEEADKKGWNYDRVGGYTNRMPNDFIP